MLKLKDKKELYDSALMLCNIYQCNEEAEKLWMTETAMIDICTKHHAQLISESFIS